MGTLVSAYVPSTLNTPCTGFGLPTFACALDPAFTVNSVAPVEFTIDTVAPAASERFSSVTTPVSDDVRDNVNVNGTDVRVRFATVSNASTVNAIVSPSLPLTSIVCGPVYAMGASI